MFAQSIEQINNKPFLNVVVYEDQLIWTSSCECAASVSVGAITASK